MGQRGPKPGTGGRPKKAIADKIAEQKTLSHIAHIVYEEYESDPEIVETAREYIRSVGGFEAFAEWGLVCVPWKGRHLH